MREHVRSRLVAVFLSFGPNLTLCQPSALLTAHGWENSRSWGATSGDGTHGKSQALRRTCWDWCIGAPTRLHLPMTWMTSLTKTLGCWRRWAWAAKTWAGQCDSFVNCLTKLVQLNLRCKKSWLEWWALMLLRLTLSLNPLPAAEPVAAAATEQWVRISSCP